MTQSSQRFNQYVQLQDGSGFTLKGNSFIFKYDKYGGWYDQFGHYYNKDAEPVDCPSQSSSQYSQSNQQDDFYEQIAKQYQYKNPSQKDEDEQEDQNIKIVQNIEINEEILNKYPQNKSLRIYYSNMDYNVNQYKLLKKFQESNDGIINVIPTINEQGKKNGEGHFILKDKQSAKKLIKTEGKIIFNRPIYYQAQTIQELLFDPIDQKYLEEQFPEIQKKYVLKQQKIQKIQQNINKQIVKQQKWLKYTFDCEIFKSGKVFKNWLKSFNLQLNADYRNLHLRKYNEKTIGSIQIRQSMVKNFLNHEFENKIVEFKSDI